jgi:hypothetical protein
MLSLRQRWDKSPGAQKLSYSFSTVHNAAFVSLYSARLEWPRWESADRLAYFISPFVKHLLKARRNFERTCKQRGAYSTPKGSRSCHIMS